MALAVLWPDTNPSPERDEISPGRSLPVCTPESTLRYSGLPTGLSRYFLGRDSGGTRPATR